MSLYKIKLSLCTGFLLLIQNFFAQVTITVPSSNGNLAGISHTEWRKPLGSYDGYERSAFIFLHSELGYYGQINSISFFCDTSIHNPGITPVRIFMRERTDSAFLTVSTVASEETGAQLVYDDTLQPADFVIQHWTTINLTNPFVHLTSRPVEIIIETNAGGSGNENNLSKSFYHVAWAMHNFQYWSADNTPPTGTGVLSYDRPNTQFNISPLPVCSGAPNAGSTASLADTTCSQVSLSLQGNTAASGISYQWQDSTVGGVWTSIPYANYSTLTTAISADSWFRCRLTCSSQSSYSTVKMVALRNYLQCYCVSGLGGGCGSGTAIDSVAIQNTGLDTGRTGCSVNDYMQYPAHGNTCAQLQSGQNYNLHTRFDGAVAASVWIDYDQNGMFDISEWKRITLSSVADSDYVTVLAVPANAKTGLTIMRIRSRAAGNSNDSTDACTSFGSGETEDYFIGVNYPVGIKQVQSKETLIVYPNPASNTLFVVGNFIENEKVRIQLFSIEGKLATEIEESFQGKSIPVDISNLNRGIYFLQVLANGFISGKKVVIR
jgi:hypothetical protein